MGIKKFLIYDHDTIEPHNLASQGYSVSEVGRRKAETTRKAILRLNPDAEVVVVPRAYQPGDRTSDLVISAVDSIEMRRRIAEGLRPEVYVVDGRMGGGQIEVWCQLASAWMDTLMVEPSDDECAARYISYTSYIIAGIIANSVKRHLVGQEVPAMVMLHADTMQVVKH